jgi:hypothetical protein
MQSSVPATLRAGDTLQIVQEIPEYSSAAGYTAKLDIVGPSNKISLTASGAGNTYTFSATPTATANFVPGLHRYVIYVTKGSDRYTVAAGNVTILENVAAMGDGVDSRTALMKIRDALLETLSGRAVSDYSEMQVSTPNGMQSITLLTLKELTEAYHHYDALVIAEERKAAIERGEPAPKILYTPDPVQ